MKILTVDDSMLVRKIIKNTIEVLNYEVVEASNAKAALEVLDKQHRDIKLILLDWIMPGTDGLELLKIIKGDGRYKDIPVAMVSSKSEEESIALAMQNGAVKYLVKPFQVEELTKLILECLW